MKIKTIALALLVVVLFGATALPTRTNAQTGLSRPVTGTLEDGGTFTGTLNITEFDVQNEQLVAIGTLTGTLRDAAGSEIGTVENEAVALPVQSPERLWLGWIAKRDVAEAERSQATSAPPVEIAQITPTVTVTTTPTVTPTVTVTTTPTVTPTATPTLPPITCDVLNLVLGPLDLNLLGLEVHLDIVILDIVANPAGGLLGQLLCGVANLLDNPLLDLLDLLRAAALLNRILELLNP